MPFAALLRHFKPRLTPEQLAEIRAFRTFIAPAVARLVEIRDQWVDLSLYERDETKLANTVAIYRWELARLGNAFHDYQPAPPIQSAHKDLTAAFADASRGCQLLATGHRFHKSETVCDGQTLLVESADTAERVLQSLDALADQA